MTIEWVINKLKEKFYPITHSDAVICENNEVLTNVLKKHEAGLTSINDSCKKKAGKSVTILNPGDTITLVGKYDPGSLVTVVLVDKSGVAITPMIYIVGNQHMLYMPDNINTSVFTIIPSGTGLCLYETSTENGINSAIVTVYG